MSLEFNLRKIIVIFIHCILLSLKFVTAGELINMKKLNTYDSYFVVLDTGLYLYNLNSFDCSIIMSFNDTIYYNSSKNKVDLNDLKNDECSYILCMVNEYSFLTNLIIKLFPIR